MATLLIVDDLSTSRQILKARLGGHGHRLLEAANGHEGLAAVHAEHPDLVITDVLMPLMDGYEFARALRFDPTTREIPVVFYTAHHGQRDARALAISTGASYVLTKPASTAEVLAVVDRALAGESVLTPPPAAVQPQAASDDEHLRLLADQLSDTAGDLRTSNARLRALINIGLELASERAPDRLLENVCVAACDLFRASSVTIGILDRHEGAVQRFVTYGVDGAAWIKTADSVSGILGTVVAERRAMRGDNRNDGTPRLQLPGPSSDVDAYLAVPIASPTHVYGWMCLVGNENKTFTENDEHLTMALSGLVGRIYENAHLSEVAQQRARALEQEILERTQAEAALRLSERLNRNLVEHLPQRIVVKDRQSVVLFCNANYAADMGLSPADVVGKNASTCDPRPVAETDEADDQDVMAKGTVTTLEALYHVGGHERWLHTVKVPYRDELGDIIGLLVVFEDITERRTLEAQYRQAQKMEAIGHLAGGVAHDFNNLVTVILGYSGLLLADEQDERKQGDLTEINHAGTRAQGLTRQLLAFSRKEIIELTTFDLNVVVTEMQPMLGRLIREDVKIVLSLRSEPVTVQADRGQMEQMILNLTLNARDAMPTGGTLTIATATVEIDEHYAKTHVGATPGPYVLLTVSDTGTGMTPQVQSRLFEPFFTTKGAGKGTGLGLATVHGIVTRSGGHVGVYSEVDRGTSLKVYMPLVEAADAAVAVSPTLVRPPTGGRRCSSWRMRKGCANSPADCSASWAIRSWSPRTRRRGCSCAMRRRASTCS